MHGALHLAPNKALYALGLTEMNGTSIKEEHWWLRWGYKLFWAFVVVGIGSCSVLTPPKQIVVDRTGEPKDWWSRLEFQVQGQRFVEAQISAVGYAIQKQEREIEKRREQYLKREEFRAQLDAGIPRRRNKDPYFAQADLLEEQVEKLRDQGVRNMLEDMNQRRLEELRETEKSLSRRRNGL